MGIWEMAFHGAGSMGTGDELELRPWFKQHKIDTHTHNFTAVCAISDASFMFDIMLSVFR